MDRPQPNPPADLVTDRAAERDRRAPGWPRVATGEWVTVASLTVVALALRLWNLDAVPPGLHVDEAFNILDARAVLDGWRPLFLPANAGREVLYTYLQAAMAAIGGHELAVWRAASAVAGATAVPLAWAVGRTLAPEGTHRATVGLLTAAFTAGSFWHLHFSRFGIRAVLFPVFVAAVVLTWRHASGVVAAGSWSRREVGAAALCGLVLGLTVYVHPAGRGLIALPALHAAWRRWRERDAAAPRRLGVTALVALVVALPMLLWWSGHPGTFAGHAQEVSIVGEGPAAVMRNAARVLGMFNIEGDPARWRNLPGRPVFDPLTGFLFVIGVAWSAWGALRARSGAALAVAWLTILAMPSVLADAAPNFSRAIGVMPVIFYFPALALERGASWLRDFRSIGTRSPLSAGGFGPLGLAVLVAVPLLAGTLTVRDYFERWATHPATRIAFDADLVALAAWAEGTGASDGPAYLSPQTADHPTVRVASTDAPIGVDASMGLVVHAAGGGRGSGAYAVLDRLPWSRAQAEALERWPEGPLPEGVVTAREPDDVPYGATVWRMTLDPGGLAPPRRAARFGPLRLTGQHVTASPEGDGLSVALVWAVEGPTDGALTATVRLVDDAGRTLAQHDRLPLDGSYPTDRWREGERVVTLHELSPSDGPTTPAGDGSVTVVVGWYALVPAPEEGATAGFRPLLTDDGRELATVTTLPAAYWTAPDDPTDSGDGR